MGCQPGKFIFKQRELCKHLLKSLEMEHFEMFPEEKGEKEWAKDKKS